MADYSIDFLYNHQSDPEWAAIVFEDPDKIIKNYPEEEWPSVCNLLAPTIGNLVFYEDYGDKVEDINKKAMRITRIGMNTVRLLESQDGFKKKKKLREHSEELYINYAMALVTQHRFIASFEFLSIAKLSLENKINQRGIEALFSQPGILLTYCYGKRAVFWAKMASDLPQQVAADYLFYADIRISKAIDSLSAMGCE